MKQTRNNLSKIFFNKKLYISLIVVNVTFWITLCVTSLFRTILNRGVPFTKLKLPLRFLGTLILFSSAPINLETQSNRHFAV